jgi:formate-dependent nitrite reductase cytochrome c552 subunit
VCPINPGKNCISCHMPKVEDPSRHARFTDHHIRAAGRITRSGDSGPRP